MRERRLLKTSAFLLFFLLCNAVIIGMQPFNIAMVKDSG
jgi:hypothetical protein